MFVQRKQEEVLAIISSWSVLPSDINCAGRSCSSSSGPPSHHEACEFVPSNHAKRTAPLVTQKLREREWSDLDYRV